MYKYKRNWRYIEVKCILHFIQKIVSLFYDEEHTS